MVIVHRGLVIGKRPHGPPNECLLIWAVKHWLVIGFIVISIAVGAKVIEFCDKACPSHFITTGQQRHTNLNRQCWCLLCGAISGSGGNSMLNSGFFWPVPWQECQE